MLYSEFKRPTIAGGEELRLAPCTTPPDRPNGMNDIGRFRLVAGGDLGVADVTTAETLTGYEQFRPSSIMNCPIDATAAE